MFSQDWSLAFEPMEIYPRFPFPERERDLVESLKYQAPSPATGWPPFFAQEDSTQAAATEAPVQAAGFLEGLPTWALLLGAGGLVLLLKK